jgi:hypothetical protein
MRVTVTFPIVHVATVASQASCRATIENAFIRATRVNLSET